MGKAQRTKGATFERAVANDLSERLGRVVQRNIGQSRDGGDDITVQPFRIECKARAGIASLAWLEQAEAASRAGEIPVVVMKADRKPWAVLMRYEDAVKLMQGELIGRE